jgi:hypothetical protein
MNIKLISTAIIILSKGFMKMDEIRQGVLAYTLVIRETKSEFLIWEGEKIIKTFRVSYSLLFLQLLVSKQSY